MSKLELEARGIEMTGLQLQQRSSRRGSTLGPPFGFTPDGSLALNQARLDGLHGGMGAEVGAGSAEIQEFDDESTRGVQLPKARRRVVKKKNKNKDTDKDTESEAAEVAEAPLDQAPVPKDAVHGTAVHAPSAAPSLVVLVVDDSRTNRVFLSRMVRTVDRRAEVLVAEDGVEGLEVLRERVRAREREREVAGGSEVYEGVSVRPAVDLVLLDFSMPRMSGPEMAQAVREDMSESVRIVPIVGVTGNALPEDQAWFCECGAQEVLCKPVRRAQVEQVLGRALELARDLAS